MSKTMSCEKLNELLPAYLERELPDSDRLAVEMHARGCAACGALIGDIERISREAAMLPPLNPSRDLWSGIEARISAPVIPLAASAGSGVRRYALRRQWFAGAAAAAALIVTTAGITYFVASRSQTAVTQRTNREAQAMLPTTPVTTAKETAARANLPSPQLASVGTRRGTGSGTLAANASATAAADQTGDAYSHEIAALERIIEERSSTLDPATVLIIERNLGVIDVAIAQSKAALARDPASKLLYDQLNHTLGKKVELLRTAARLPSTT